MPKNKSKTKNKKKNKSNSKSTNINNTDVVIQNILEEGNSESETES